jgi:integrase
VDGVALPRALERQAPDEVWSLVRATASDTDASIFLTAAFTDLRRGELLAPVARRRLRGLDDSRPRELRGRISHRAEVGKVRSVPMAADVASALEGLWPGERFSGEDEFVFQAKRGIPLHGDALSERHEDALQRAGCDS